MYSLQQIENAATFVTAWDIGLGDLVFHQICWQNCQILKSIAKAFWSGLSQLVLENYLQGTKAVLGYPLP